MCGKFTARASWRDLTDFAWDRPAPDLDDPAVTYRVMANIPVIVRHDGARRAVSMRWGFPDPNDWRKPRPIHARSETIDTTPTFATAFRDGQRGIVLVQTFNEAPDIDGKSGPQHTITPGGPIGIAFVWRRFAVDGQDLFACVMATVPANALIGGLPTDRVPAVLASQDWETWLAGDAQDAKACLKTVDDARWTMRAEERARAKPTVREPTGLF